MIEYGKAPNKVPQLPTKKVSTNMKTEKVENKDY